MLQRYMTKQIWKCQISDISDIENYLAEAEKEFLKNVEPMDLEQTIQNLNDAIQIHEEE